MSDGKLDCEFVVDIFQTGSSTSTNMNANEVIANRALEILGRSREAPKIHPNGQVNMSQSSNDVIPTALRLGQEFSGYARQIELSIECIKAAAAAVAELPLGGTATGRVSTRTRNLPNAPSRSFPR